MWYIQSITHSMQFEFIKEAFLFPTPLFIYRFASFEQHREEMYRYFDLDGIWLENEKRNNLVAHVLIYIKRPY